MKSEPIAETRAGQGRWYRQPLVWFGGLVFAALVTGIAATIVVASRFADEPLPVAADRVLATPVTRDEAPVTRDEAPQ